MKKLLLNSILLLCALVVGTSAWATDVTTGSLTWPTPQLSENFNGVSTTSATAKINGTTSAYGIFNKMYNNNTANTYAIASNATFGSNVLSLTMGSGSPLIASVTGQTFATKGAFSFKVLKTSKCYVGLYASSTDNNATSKSLTSVYIQNNAGAISIANYNSSGNGSTTWQSVGSYSTDYIEICVVYNNTTSADTYGGSISLGAKKAHVFVNGTCIMNGENPKAFDIPGFELTTFRTTPIATSGNTAIVDDIVIYNSLPTSGGGDPVAATGVSLNKSTTSLTVGDTEKLTATVAPNNATDKVVSWNSNNTSVATVDSEGNVTAEALGTARITVTTHDGSFTDYCDVTVVPETVTLDFTSNTTWSFPTSKTEGTNSYTNGYTITLKGSSGQGYYFDTSSNNLLLGKNGATLTLPAFPFNVNKIKVYGTSSAAAGVTFNVYVGDVAVSTEATSSKVDHEFEIAAESQDAGTAYIIKVTNDNNMRITKIKIFGYETVSVGSSKYAAYCSTNALDFTNTEVKAYKAKVDGGKVVLTQIDEVPDGTGVILYGDADDYDVPVIASAAAVTENELIGVTTRTLVEWETGGDGKYNYILQNGQFKKAATGGHLKANRAYLHTSYDVTSAGARDYLEFSFEGDVNSLNEVTNTNRTNNTIEYFDLQGRKIAQPAKGLYIVNGKKVVIK